MARRKKASNKHEVTVINDQAVEGAGAVVFWSLHGPTDYATLRDGWREQELDEAAFVKPATAEAALRATIKTCAGSLPKGFFTKQLGREAFIIVREDRSGDDAKTSTEDYRAVFKLGTLKEEGKSPRLWLKWGRSAGGGIKKVMAAYIATVKEQYRQAIDELSVHNLGWWFTRMLNDYAHVLPLKERGGVYYVPPGKIETWGKIVAAFSDTDHVFHQIPAMKTGDCAAAVLDACLREVVNVTEGIYEELDDTVSALGKRALKTRVQNLDDLLSKMTSYESIIGPQIDGLRESIEDCKASVVEAELAMMDDLDD